MRTQILAICLGVVFCFISSTVHAQLTFCNEAPLTIQVAFGTPIGPYWQSEGWRVLNPGECSPTVSTLANQYYYAYAETPGGKWTWDDAENSYNLCVGENSFTILQGNCDAEDTRSFFQIDVNGASSFTYPFTCPDCLDSDLVDAVKQNTNVLEILANQAAPLSYQTPDWVDVGPVDIQYGLSRSPFTIEIDGNEISISARLYYWLKVSHRPLGIRMDLASCGVNEPQPEADVTFKTIFGITPEGKLSSKTSTDIKFLTSCNLTIFNINATGHIQEAVQPQLDHAAALIDSRIREIDVSQIIDVQTLY